jgi:putative transposase
MPRRPRLTPAGLVYHVLNRAVARRAIFFKDPDYAAFERVLAQALARSPGLELFTYCLMPNHWHLVLRPAADGQLSDFMQWVTVTHTQRWHAHNHTFGTGHLYQGRFKSFPVETDDHFLALCRYVERNPLRAQLVTRAELWRWSAVWRRVQGHADRPTANISAPPSTAPHLSPWPVDQPTDWLALLNRPQPRDQEEALRQSIRKGRPFGSETYQQWTSQALGLSSAFRNPARPSRKTRDIQMQNET